MNAFITQSQSVLLPWPPFPFKIPSACFYGADGVLAILLLLIQTIEESDLEYIEKLGSGNYGTVYYGKWKGSDVAIKKIKPSCFCGDAKEDDGLVITKIQANFASSNSYNACMFSCLSIMHYG